MLLPLLLPLLQGIGVLHSQEVKVNTLFKIPRDTSIRLVAPVDPILESLLMPRQTFEVPYPLPLYPTPRLLPLVLHLHLHLPRYKSFISQKKILVSGQLFIRNIIYIPDKNTTTLMNTPLLQILL